MASRRASPAWAATDWWAIVWKSGPAPRHFSASDDFKEGPAAIEFSKGHITSITSLSGTAPLEAYKLEPEVITTLFDSSRNKRRLIRYQDLPKSVVNAVVAAEDHSFFTHHGVNLYRILASGLHDFFRSDEVMQGGSTLTMQLARNIFGLSTKRTVGRKLKEIFLALLLEQRLNKEEIFELYANQIYLGQRGSFSIYGFGEAASAYFNKDVGSLTPSEAALLAGVIRGPNIYSPYKYPSRALERRNFVLRSMMEQGTLTPKETEQASAAPLGVVVRNVESTQAPFFVDMVKDQLLSQFSEHDLLSESYRIYTTLDMDVQQAASAAVDMGAAEIDKRLKPSKLPKDAPKPDPLQPQMALVVLDPHTGWLRAMVGGRDYSRSQLNHALAKRQPGSSFKPFVYAAALTSGVDGSQPLITPATLLNDEPTTFQFGDVTYEPENFKQEYMGQVTLRTALMYSLNVATVRLAEMVGYDKVRNLALAAGFNRGLMATPAIALGFVCGDAAGSGRCLHDILQRRDLRRASVPAGCQRLLRPPALAKPGSRPAGVGPARRLPDGQPAGKRLEQRHGGGGAGPRLHPARRRQNRDLPRRLVCRLHLQPVGGGLGGVR